MSELYPLDPTPTFVRELRQGFCDPEDFTRVYTDVASAIDRWRGSFVRPGLWTQPRVPNQSDFPYSGPITPAWLGLNQPLLINYWSYPSRALSLAETADRKGVRWYGPPTNATSPGLPFTGVDALVVLDPSITGAPSVAIWPLPLDPGRTLLLMRGAAVPVWRIWRTSAGGPIEQLRSFFLPPGTVRTYIERGGRPVTPPASWMLLRDGAVPGNGWVSKGLDIGPVWVPEHHAVLVTIDLGFGGTDGLVKDIDGKALGNAKFPDTWLLRMYPSVWLQSRRDAENLDPFSGFPVFAQLNTSPYKGVTAFRLDSLHYEWMSYRSEVGSVFTPGAGFIDFNGIALETAPAPLLAFSVYETRFSVEVVPVAATTEI